MVLIRQAGEAGLDKAQYNLGKIYRDGTGVPADIEAAAQWFLAAARQGHTRAQTRIGMRYVRGQGIQADPVEAMKWLTLAADAGDPDATEARTALAADLTPEQTAEAERRARAWTPARP